MRIIKMSMRASATMVTVITLSVLCSCGPSAYVRSGHDTSNEMHDIGYGSVAEEDLMGAVGKVKISKSQAIYTNIYDYLKGKVAGVDVNGTTITIRGIRSINGPSEPLILVNGAIVSDISGISPSIVESVEVLKDATYTAAYGSRGANGVILITLKK